MFLGHLKNTSNELAQDGIVGRTVGALWHNIRTKVFTNYSKKSL